MLSINSSKTSPINISIFEKKLSSNILKDDRYSQLIQLLSDKNNISKYRYAFYTDVNELKQNIFVPIFHTLYLGCSNNNVIIGSLNDIWLVDSFPNNKYFIIKSSLKDEKLSNNLICIIDHMNQIGTAL